LEKFKFTVLGKPLGKQRIRVTRQGISYTPKETVNYENYIKEMFIYSGGKMLEGAIGLTITAYLYIPKSTSKVKREKMLAGIIPAAKRPDGSNILKAVEDSLNKIAYKDDSQIVELEVKKVFGNEPKLVIELKELANDW